MMQEPISQMSDDDLIWFFANEPYGMFAMDIDAKRHLEAELRHRQLFGRVEELQESLRDIKATIRQATA